MYVCTTVSICIISIIYSTNACIRMNYSVDWLANEIVLTIISSICASMEDTRVNANRIISFYIYNDNMDSRNDVT